MHTFGNNIMDHIFLAKISEKDHRKMIIRQFIYVILLYYCNVYKQIQQIRTNKNIVIYLMKPYRSISHQTPKKSSRHSENELSSSHIVEQSLDRKGKLISKYQTELSDLMEQIDAKQPYRRQSASKGNKLLAVDPTHKRKRAISSLRNETNNIQAAYNGGGSMKDYQKLILGLQFAVETEKNKSEELSVKNASLQSEISNLRNLLMGPDEQKYYEKTAFKQSQEKITYLENRIIDQKKQYEFIINSKNQEIVSLEKQTKILAKKVTDDSNNDKTLSKKLLEMTAEMEELQTRITRKNIQIQRLKYQNIKEDDSDDQEVTKMRKSQRLKFYLQQMEISNRLILRKNTEILQLTNKIINYQKILDVIQLYLDKKEVKHIDLPILEHPCVNKLRILLREKAVFQRELLNQLNEHNKKINIFETEVIGRDKHSNQKLTEVINDNKRLAATVSNLQSNIANLEKELDQSRRDNEMAENQIVINKRQFIEEVTKLKQELGTISSVTKNEFDRMKIQNLKLTEQNRSLLFLVGEKEREIHKKGEAIRTFEDYRQKINTLDVGEKEKRKIQMVSEDNPHQIGSKLLLINNFSNWLFQWNKIKNWANKKTLLNLILDREQIRKDSLSSLPYVITVIHDCFLVSKNIEIQERATILLAHYVPHKLISHKNLYIGKLAPIVIRGLRPIIEGQQQQKHQLLNESALKILNSMQINNIKWSHEMTNEMLSINGLKYVFDTLSKNGIDQLIQSSYNVLIMIAKQNEMISFMMSYDISNFVLKNLVNDNSFIVFTLTLLKHLLQGQDYMKMQKSMTEFRKLFDLISQDDDQEVIELVLDCIETLCNKSVGGFVKSLDKLKSMSILIKLLRKNHEETTYQILKKVGKIYIVLVTELETDNLGKYIKSELDKLLQLVKQKRLNEPRFGRALKMIQKLTPLFLETPQFDNKTLPIILQLYSLSEQMDSKLRLKVSQIAHTIYKRNPECLNKFSTESFIGNLIETYKICNNVSEELQLILGLILFQCDQKRVVEVLRSGRESFISKLISDSLLSDYTVTVSALKVLLYLSKQKFIEKFLNNNLISSIVNKVLNQRGQEQYLGIVLSALYFLTKIETIGLMAIQNGIVPKICNVIVERHDKESLVFKSLAVLQVLHTTHYKKKILSYIISKEGNLQILKVLNFSLRKAKNKIQLGTRSIFIYDYLNSKVAVESLALLTERNQWIVEDLVLLRNVYVQKLDSLVYKIELLLHEMSKVSNKVKKLYEKYRVEGDRSDEDDD